MAIAISIGSAIDIETYDGLITFIVEHLQLDAETETQVPTFIRMAEYRLNRLLESLERETSADYTTTATVRHIDLPDDYAALRAVVLDDVPLRQEALADTLARTSGKPLAYAVAGDAIQFGPVPDGEYGVTIRYMAKLVNLSEANQTNWLLSDHADAYVYATLVQAEAYLGHDRRIPMLETALVTVIEEINQYANRQRHSGPLVPNLSVAL